MRLTYYSLFEIPLTDGSWQVLMVELSRDFLINSGTAGVKNILYKKVILLVYFEPNPLPMQISLTHGS